MNVFKRTDQLYDKLSKKIERKQNLQMKQQHDHCAFLQRFQENWQKLCLYHMLLQALLYKLKKKKKKNN